MQHNSFITQHFKDVDEFWTCENKKKLISSVWAP